MSKSGLQRWVSRRCTEILPIHTGNITNTDTFRTLGLTLGFIGTVTESQFIHLSHHR